jgi:ABC-type Na+ efflux pump permease subunit
MSLIIAADLGANAAIEDPNGTWAQIAAFLPPLSPMVVPTRVVLGDMGASGSWQQWRSSCSRSSS